MSDPLPTANIFIDTDIGVDDAAAIAWLLQNQSANVIGLTTVAGNTSVENATRNLLTLLHIMGRDLPVTRGAAAPLIFPAPQIGISALVHGPSGLWFAQVAHDLSGIPSDAPAAIAQAARAHPDITLLALGPLTNVALAAQRFPADLARVRVVALIGAKVGGNRTPVAEFNAFFDPHALDIALNSGLDLTLVTLDAFEQLRVDAAEFPQSLVQQGGALGQFLAAALSPYFQSTSGGDKTAALPDAAAAIFALHPELGRVASALVEVVVDGGLTRGQTIIGTEFRAKIPMIADDNDLAALADRAFNTPDFDLNTEIGQILMRRPDNAKVVLDIDADAMRSLLARGLTS